MFVKNNSMSLLSNIYVITIKRNLERQTRMTNLLGEYNLQFSFIEGEDGGQLDKEKSKQVFDAYKSRAHLGYDVTKNEIACSLSHIKALKTFLENDKQDCALFLEDDISISNFESLESAFKLMPKPNEWDLLYLGYQQMNMKIPINIYLKCLLAYPILNSLKLKRYDLQKIKRIFGRPYNNYWFRAGSHNNAHAYIVSKSAAKKIIDYNTPVFLQADVLLMDMIVEGKLRAFGLNKPVFHQSADLASSIGARESWV
jgi:GR25 family glycosyltransferase involved in LPS biosynthesis